MIYNVTSLPEYIEIGRVGENEVTELSFDFSTWAQQYGEGLLSLLLRRPGEEIVYPVALTVSGTVATWTVSSTDTSFLGDGAGELVYTVDEKIKKSACFTSRILCALTGSTVDPPAPYETYVEQILTAATQVAEDAQAASDSAAAAAASAASVNAPELNRRILAAFPTGTAGPAAVVNIDDGADGIPVKRLQVDVAPALNGLNALTIHVSPTQIADDGNTYSFPFQTPVYGGTFILSYDGDWSASMTVDMARYNLSNTTAFAWVTTGWGGWRTGNLAWIEGQPDTSRYVAENYPSLPYSDVTARNIGIAVGDGGSYPRRVYVYTGDTVTPPSGLAVFPIANPQTITWTQAQLLEILGTEGFCTLLGINSVWADTGETSMTYRQDVGIVIGKLLASI